MAINGTNVTLAEWVSIAPACVISLMTPICLIGNSLVVASIILSNKLRTKTNAFVVSLAATDLLSCASFPVQASSFLGPPPKFLCEMTGAISYITLLASINNLMLIAVNRWFKITRSATEYNRVYSPRNMVLMIVVSWIHPCLISLVPAIAGVFRFGYSYSTGVCYLTDDARGEYYLVIHVYTAWVYTTIITAIIIGAYINLAWVIHKKRRQVAAVGGRDVKITQTLAIVVFVFLMAIGVCAICQAFTQDPMIWKFSIVLLISNSIVNPFIYALKHPVFQQTFKCIIKCRFRDIPEPSRQLRAILRFQEEQS